MQFFLNFYTINFNIYILKSLIKNIFKLLNNLIQKLLENAFDQVF
jgi:hypothetical protein